MNYAQTQRAILDAVKAADATRVKLFGMAGSVILNGFGKLLSHIRADASNGDLRLAIILDQLEAARSASMEEGDEESAKAYAGAFTALAIQVGAYSGPICEAFEAIKEGN